MVNALEQLVQAETAHSGLAFREHVYAADEQAALLRDVLALANAAVQGPRFLFLGVRDAVGGERRINGITLQAWHEFKRRLSSMLGGMTEPPVKVAVRSLRMGDALVGMLCLTACDDQPYLLAADLGTELRAGNGWVRRGTSQAPLLRADLQRMFASRVAASAPSFELRIGFPGSEPQNELTLPALDLVELPSAVAARKLVKVLQAKESARAMLGRTETHLSRLVHAHVFGVGEPYVSHSDESLRLRAASTAETHRAADEHYAFEVRAHKFELVVANAGTSPLHNVGVRVRVPTIDGIGIAERLYDRSGAVADSGDYPLVNSSERAITLETSLGAAPPGTTTRVFRQPPRLWVRPEAVGKTIPVEVTLHARELREPISDTLIVRFVKEAP